MKDFKFCFLKDIYGGLLTKTQNEMLSLYYEEDMSLFEIAEEKNISRQAVRDSIKKAETQLSHYEETLGVLSKKNVVAKMLIELDVELSAHGQQEASEKVKAVISNL